MVVNRSGVETALNMEGALQCDHSEWMVQRYARPVSSVMSDPGSFLTDKACAYLNLASPRPPIMRDAVRESMNFSRPRFQVEEFRPNIFFSGQ